MARGRWHQSTGCTRQSCGLIFQLDAPSVEVADTAHIFEAHSPQATAYSSCKTASRETRGTGSCVRGRLSSGSRHTLPSGSQSVPVNVLPLWRIEMSFSAAAAEKTTQAHPLCFCKRDWADAAMCTIQTRFVRMQDSYGWYASSSDR